MCIHGSGGLVKPNYIINFPTKDHWRGASKIEFIRGGLVDLVVQVRRLGIRSIAIPPLRCGNGGLDAAQVRPLIEAAFEVLPDVEVRLFEPVGAAGSKVDGSADQASPYDARTSGDRQGIGHVP